MSIDELKSVIAKLSVDERKKLISDIQLEHFKRGSYLDEILKQQESDIQPSCPRCKGTNIWSRGSYKGVKRLKCTDCNKYFSSTSGTAIYNIHKTDKWQAYLQCMKEGLTLRLAAARIGISLQTSFNWRHKILSSLSDIESDHFTGIVEADEIYFHFSEKGKRILNRKPRKRGNDGSKLEKENKLGVLVTADRSGHKLARVVGRSTMRKEALSEALSGKIDKSAVLCTDSYKVYIGLAKKDGLNHKAVTHLGRPIQKNKAYHIQTVNNLHKELREHLSKFNGVSSKYLQNYLYWFLAKVNKMADNEKLKLWLWLSITIKALHELQRMKSIAL
ncbi:MAG TPA: IS1595 family transposase [Bacteroidales bacterium]|nr:IS1595 family transposase [Bacteroidales bacterium]